VNKSKAPPLPTTRVRSRDSNAFDPRYKDALLAGLANPLVLEFDSNREAIRFRARCQAYRFAVKLENQDSGLIALLYRVKTTVEGRKVTISPVDSEFEKQLSSIPTLDAPLPITSSPPRISPPSESSDAPTLEDLMADLDNFVSHPSDEKEI
jgi:hypothetical protein